MRASMICRSGIVMRSSLCIGVNQRVEPPVTPYLSRLQRVRTNQILFSGHHKAWSDQSFDAASTNRHHSTTVRLFASYIETTQVQTPDTCRTALFRILRGAFKKFVD